MFNRANHGSTNKTLYQIFFCFSNFLNLYNVNRLIEIIESKKKLDFHIKDTRLVAKLPNLSKKEKTYITVSFTIAIHF